MFYYVIFESPSPHLNARTKHYVSMHLHTKPTKLETSRLQVSLLNLPVRMPVTLGGKMGMRWDEPRVRRATAVTCKSPMAATIHFKYAASALLAPTTTTTSTTCSNMSTSMPLAATPTITT